MKWIEAKVFFEADNHGVAQDLISNIFYELGMQGVVVENPEYEPGQGLIPDEEITPDYHAVTGFIPGNSLADNRGRLLEDELAGLKGDEKFRYKIVYHEIDEEDWSESWKKFFFPEKISRNMVVKPTWCEYSPKNGEIILEIDPGMAFGTGTHPTTSMCINMIEKYITPGDSFLDVGTGSGILMIAAEKSGAKKMWGIDIDEVAIEITEKNLLQNQVLPTKFKLFSGTLDQIHNEKFNLVTANILSEVIICLLHNIKDLLYENGIVICSGIIKNNKDKVLKRMQTIGLKVLEIQEKEEWICLIATIQ